MGWGLLGQIGNGFKKVGHGLLDGVDNAAMNSLTGGGLLSDALGGQGAPPIDKRQLRGSYLMNLGGALSQGRPLGEGVQQFQQQGISQIQAAQQVQQQRARQAAMGQFQQEMQGAGGDPAAQQQVLMKHAPMLGPEATKQYADAFKSLRPEAKQDYVPVGDLGYLNKATGEFQAIPRQSPQVSPERQAFEGLLQKHQGDATAAFTELQSITKPPAQQRENNPTEASLAQAAAAGDPAALRALQLLRGQHAPQGGGGTPVPKMAPPSVITGITQNNRNLRTIDDALAELETDPNATGYKGFLPEAMLNRVDPKGTNARAAIANIGSLQIHDRTGAAMSKSEAERLLPFVPSAHDDLPTVKKKLMGLRSQISSINDDIASAYSEGFKPLPQYGGRPQPPQQPAGGVPAVGGMFNGGKVLKVTRIP